MAQDNGPNRQRQDGNGSSGSSLLLWAGLIVASGLLVIMWAAPYFTREVQPADLMALIVASPHVVKSGEIQKDAKGYIDVIEKDGKVPTPRRYSNLQGVVVRDRSITGRIDVVDLVPQGVGKQLEPS